MLKFECPTCKKSLKANTSQSSFKVKCPHCSNTFKYNDNSMVMNSSEVLISDTALNDKAATAQIQQPAIKTTSSPFANVPDASDSFINDINKSAANLANSTEQSDLALANMFYEHENLKSSTKAKSVSLNMIVLLVIAGQLGLFQIYYQRVSLYKFYQKNILGQQADEAKSLIKTVTLPVKAVTEAQEFLLYMDDLSATSEREPLNRWEFIQGPEGLTFNTENGTLKWTPDEKQGPGKHLVKLKRVQTIEGKEHQVDFILPVEVVEAYAKPELLIEDNLELDSDKPKVVSYSIKDSDYPAIPVTLSILSKPDSVNVVIQKESIVMSANPVTATQKVNLVLKLDKLNHPELSVQKNIQIHHKSLVNTALVMETKPVAEQQAVVKNESSNISQTPQLQIKYVPHFTANDITALTGFMNEMKSQYQVFYELEPKKKPLEDQHARLQKEIPLIDNEITSNTRRADEYSFSMTNIMNESRVNKLDNQTAEAMRQKQLESMYNTAQSGLNTCNNNINMLSIKRKNNLATMDQLNLEHTKINNDLKQAGLKLNTTRDNWFNSLRINECSLEQDFKIIDQQITQWRSTDFMWSERSYWEILVKFEVANYDETIKLCLKSMIADQRSKPNPQEKCRVLSIMSISYYNQDDLKGKECADQAKKLENAAGSKHYFDSVTYTLLGRALSNYQNMTISANDYFTQAGKLDGSSQDRMYYAEFLCNTSNEKFKDIPKGLSILRELWKGTHYSNLRVGNKLEALLQKHGNNPAELSEVQQTLFELKSLIQINLSKR